MLNIKECCILGEIKAIELEKLIKDKMTYCSISEQYVLKGDE